MPDYYYSHPTSPSSSQRHSSPQHSQQQPQLLSVYTTPLHSHRLNRPSSRPFSYDSPPSPSNLQQQQQQQQRRYKDSYGRPLLLPSSPQQHQQQHIHHRQPLPQHEDTWTLAFFISDILFPPSSPPSIVVDL